MTDDKLEFEKRLVDALEPEAWFGTVLQFGAWWAARDGVEADVETVSPAERVLRLRVSGKIEGLVLSVPAAWRLERTEPAGLRVEHHDRSCTLGHLQGDLALFFAARSGSGP